MTSKSSDFSSQFSITVMQSANGKYRSAIYDDHGDEEWHSEDDVSRDEVYEQACLRLDSMTEAWLESQEPEEPHEDDRKNGVSEKSFLYKRP